MSEAEQPKSFSALEFGIISVIVLVILGISVPSFIRVKQAANEASTAAALRNLNVALMQHYEKNGTLPQPLEQLGPSGAGLIDGKLATGLKNDYRFIYSRVKTGLPIQRAYTITPSPLSQPGALSRSIPSSGLRKTD
jgi:Tfp pilus assembly protein PilE